MPDPATLAAFLGLSGGAGGAAAAGAAGAGLGSLGTLGTLATTGLALSSAFKGGPSAPPPPAGSPPVPPSLYQGAAQSNYADTAAKAAAAQNATIGTSTQGDTSAPPTAKPGVKTLLGQ